ALRWRRRCAVLAVPHVMPDVSSSGNRKQKYERSADQISNLDTSDQNQTVSDRNPRPRLDDADCGGLEDSKRDQGNYDKNAEIGPAQDAKEAIERRQEQHTGANLRRSYPGSSNHVYSFLLSPHYLSADGITPSACNSGGCQQRFCCRDLVNRQLTSLEYRLLHHRI